MVLKLKKKKKKITYFQVPAYGHQRSQYQLLAGLGLKHKLESGYITSEIQKGTLFHFADSQFFF